MGTCKPSAGFPGKAETGTGTGTGRSKTQKGEEKIVLFASTRPFGQWMDIKAVYDAYDGAKEFVQVDPYRHHGAIRSGKYALMVCDEFPTESPGKAVLLCHGFPGCKLSGLDQPHPYHSRKHAGLIDYAVATSKGTVGIMASFCGIPESSVLPLGAPRTDAYVGKYKGDGGTMLAGKRSYLYMPTYRAREETPMPDIDWEWIDCHLLENEVLAVKPHQMTGKLLHGEYRKIVELPPEGDYLPYLADCDVVITDYSASMVDGYLLRKPCVLFEKNKGYTETRGMYLDYPGKYCSRYATEEDSLLELVRAADGLTKTELDCVELLAGACDGGSAGRVIDLIRSLL